MMEKDEKKNNALQLATQFQISTKWLEICAKENSLDLQKYMKKNENLSVCNLSVAVAYAYMCLVIPKESDLFKNVNGNKDSKVKEIIKKIEYKKYTYGDEKDLKSVVRHVRNALSHGNINFKDDKIIFYDKDDEHNKEGEFLINYLDFMYLIDEVFFSQKKQHFNKKINSLD